MSEQELKDSWYLWQKRRKDAWLVGDDAAWEEANRQMMDVDAELDKRRKKK